MYRPYMREELVIKEIEYFWPGVIAYGFPAYVNGPTGLGKTNVFLKVGADATRGVFEPGVKDGYLAKSVEAEPIKMFYVSTENPVCEIVYPALLYNNADESMFKIQKEEDGHFELCEEDLKAVMDDFSPRLIVVDAFQEHLPKGYNLSDGDNMSELMRIWENFAYKYKVALILIGNDSKGAESRSDANKMLGSGVIARRARTLITVKESGHEKYLQVTKRLGYKKKAETRMYVDVRTHPFVGEMTEKGWRPLFNDRQAHIAFTKHRVDRGLGTAGSSVYEMPDREGNASEVSETKNTD